MIYRNYRSCIFCKLLDNIYETPIGTIHVYCGRTKLLFKIKTKHEMVCFEEKEGEK